MPPGQGGDSWVSFAEEVTYGTAAGTGEIYARLRSETMDANVSTKEYPGLGGTVRKAYDGNMIVGGNIEPEIHFGGHGLLLKHAMGGYSFAADTPVAGANTHTFTYSPTLPTGLTVEDSKGDIPSDQVFLYEGGKIAQLNLQWDSEEWLRHIFTFIAQKETPATARSGAPSYPSDHPMLWHFLGTVTLVADTIDVKRGNFMIDNNLVRRFLSSKLTKEPIRAGKAKYTGQVVGEFENLTHYNKYKAGTEGALGMTYTSDEMITGVTPYSLSIVVAASRLVGETPKVSGDGPMELPLKFWSLGTSPVSITLVNADTTYA